MGGKLFKSSDSSDNTTTNSDTDTNNNKFITINREYISTKYKEGILRLILIITLLGGWISAAAAPRVTGSFFAPMWVGFNSTRTAYLVISVAAFIFSIIVFMVNFINITRFESYEANVKKWSIVVIIVDVLFWIMLLAVSITAAVRESQLYMYGSSIFGAINRGAFGAAAFFGFLSLIVLTIILVVGVINLRRNIEEPTSVYMTKTRHELASGSREIPIEVYRENASPSPKDKSEVIL